MSMKQLAIAWSAGISNLSLAAGAGLYLCGNEERIQVSGQGKILIAPVWHYEPAPHPSCMALQKDT